MNKVAIIGASGKLGQYMIQHCLDRGYEVVGVCRDKSVPKLERFADRITILAGRTDDRALIQRAVAGCDGVLTVLVPWGRTNYSSGTAQAVLDFAEPEARLIFSCGWHISKDGKDKLSWKVKFLEKVVGPVIRFLRLVDLSDQVEACRRIFASDTRYTVARGATLIEGESDGMPVWADHAHDPLMASDALKRVDYALFMVEALTDDRFIQQAPALNGRGLAPATAHAGSAKAAANS